MSDAGPDREHPNRRLLPRCPRCHGLVLRPVSDGEDVNFLCLSCFRCWHVELGYVQRVDPHTCAGCAALAKCTKAFAIDHPEPATA